MHLLEYLVRRFVCIIPITYHGSRDDEKEEILFYQK